MINKTSKQEQPDDPMYYVHFGYLLNRSGSLGAAFMSDLLKAFDIPLPIWQVLMILSDFGEQTTSELASHTGIELSHLSRLVLKAEKRGFVKRARSSEDKRVIQISLASTGQQTIGKVLPKARVLAGIMLNGISQADLDVTIRTLRTVYDNLETKAACTTEHDNRKLTIARRTRKSRTE